MSQTAAVKMELRLSSMQSFIMICIHLSKIETHPHRSHLLALLRQQSYAKSIWTKFWLNINGYMERIRLLM